MENEDIVGKELRIHEEFKDSKLGFSSSHTRMLGQLVKVVKLHNNRDYVYVETVESDSNIQIFPKAFIIEQLKKYDVPLEKIIEEIRELNRQVWSQKIL